MIRKIYDWSKANFELICWMLFVCTLYFLAVNRQEQSLCLSGLLGLGKCPGCGLGHSIHYALHGDIRASFQTHILGIPALFIIFKRIYQLLFIPKYYL